MRRFHYSVGTSKIKEIVLRRSRHFGPKLAWFIQKGYVPHVFQLAFHTNSYDEGEKVGRLLLFRMLVAGRRGGKTLSAAWEVVYYVLHPEQFHLDIHGKDSDEPLHVWILVPNFKTAGRAAEQTLRKVLKQCGLKDGLDYKWNKGDKYIEFPNGSLIEFKTAEQAESLVGAGIDILWMDETAVIPKQDAYDYASPALDDKEGIVIGTSTPRGKNWWYELFWTGDALEDPDVGTVEYTSIHNPYFPKSRWLLRKRTFHPMRFKQEYMAAFDSMAGKVLSGEWLFYYSLDELPRKSNDLPIMANGKLNVSNLALDIFVGVDPATGEGQDRFAVTVLGVPEDKSRVFMLYQYAGKITFPDQVDLIQRLFVEWRPQYIGIEAIASQKYLVQQTMRLEGLPPIVPVFSKGNKKDRILTMSPLFKMGKVVIRDEFKDFIDEWLDYDPDLSHPKDDTLDATEIALGAAGVLLAGMPAPTTPKQPQDLSELAVRIRADMAKTGPDRGYDTVLGSDW
jgi:phage terminase large subunit-like protein